MMKNKKSKKINSGFVRAGWEIKLKRQEKWGNLIDNAENQTKKSVKNSGLPAVDAGEGRGDLDRDTDTTRNRRSLESSTTI